MKTNIFKTIFAAAVISLSSCTGLLDMTPPDRVSDKVIWETTESAEYAINYIYSYAYDITMGQSAAGQTEAFTDQLKYGSYNNATMCLIPSQIAYGNKMFVDEGTVDVYLGTWGWLYGAIRRVNQSLSELEEFGLMPAEDKARLEGELKFMRAFIYFDLAKRYGKLIIYDEDMSKITKNKALSEEKEVWDFIEKDLRDAATILPDRSASKGRLNKGIAWAFMSRAMLYAERWNVVLEAAEEVEKLGYDLETSYADAYSKTTMAGNNEAIFQYHFDRSKSVTHSFDFYYTPGGDYAVEKETGGGWGTPTQEMVESYEYATGGKPDWSKWHDTTNETPPYEQLEPRFKATILYNGAKWKNRTIEPYIGGIDGWCEWKIESKEPKGRTTTGYYLRKMVDEGHDVINQSGSEQPITIIRYAEVLLNKAEACQKLSGKEELANAAVRAIRERVGLPYTDKAGTQLWEAIRQERKVELAYEGLWYWDLRRWRVADQQYPVGLCGYQVHGLKIEKNDDGTFTYTYMSVDDENRNFDSRMYRFPIPTGELSSNDSVDQFPEWL